MRAPGRLIRRALVLAGPLSLLATLLMLIASRDAFRHGPGVPTAGTEEAWAVLWLGLALVTGGHALSFCATVGWLACSLRAGGRLDEVLGAAIVYHVLVGGPLLWWLFG